MVKETLILCDRQRRLAKCHDSPAVQDYEIWPDHLVTFWREHDEPVSRQRHAKGFVEQEFHWLGDLAMAERSREDRRNGRRWFEMYTGSDGPPEPFNFEKEPMLPLEPYPLELLYRPDIEGIHVTGWETYHNTRPPALKPDRIDKANPGGSCERIWYSNRDNDPRESLPHIQVARNGHEMFGWKFALWETIMLDMVQAPGEILERIVDTWQAYLYWLRLSLMKIQRLPGGWSSFTTAEGFTVSGRELDTWAYGQGKTYNDVIASVESGELWPLYWDRAAYKVVSYWKLFRQREAGYQGLINLWREERSELGHCRLSATYRIWSTTIVFGADGGFRANLP
ncbi:hypothetical protein QBC41DRAFT_270137 [Cercophora samala]|uniref:Uncharacterized protein n=1 Tax=Cercophora samala TaxID=330535 RepID=A0AA39ZIB5_9PEZI|nr:hypothetical protein QBC41DRAFT_270137 [Cercophora samala]